MSRQRTSVLIVDDELNLRRVLAREVAAMGYQALEAGDGEGALAALERQEVGVVLLDLRLPGRDGLDLLPELRRRWPRTEVIMLTGHGSVDAAIQAMKAGAYDFLQKPCHLDELELLIQRALEKRALAERNDTLADPGAATAIEWGRSPALLAVRQDLAKVAPTDAPVLVLGESGTGKELVARELHARSLVAGGPFVAINCGAIAPSLVESLLFGHERGAFTGADKRKLGLVEVADQGTLFLDEVGDLPLDLQVKLLRFLQFGEVLRVGATEPVQVTVRVVAATHRDLDRAIAEGTFREDLYYRLGTVRLELPPLRARPGDVPVLVERFLAELEAKGRPRRRFTPEALEVLERYGWPGNVRELRMVVERLSILADREEIDADEVALRLGRGGGAGAARATLELRTIKEAEQELVVLALQRFRGDKPAAARALGVALKTLYNKIKAYEIDVDAVLREG
ncbi:MAG: sigma-54-dependent transcriptional regulator [Planctomycetota bacterium]